MRLIFLGHNVSSLECFNKTKLMNAACLINWLPYSMVSCCQKLYLSLSCMYQQATDNELERPGTGESIKIVWSRGNRFGRIGRSSSRKPTCNLKPSGSVLQAERTQYGFDQHKDCWYRQTFSIDWNGWFQRFVKWVTSIINLYTALWSLAYDYTPAVRRSWVI